MATQFNSTLTSSIGTTPTTLFTATVKHILIGCTLTNKTTATLPITAYIARGTETIYICYQKRIPLGDNYEVVQKGKFVLEPGDQIIAVTEK